MKNKCFSARLNCSKTIGEDHQVTFRPFVDVDKMGTRTVADFQGSRRAEMMHDTGFALQNRVLSWLGSNVSSNGRLPNSGHQIRRGVPPPECDSDSRVLEDEPRLLGRLLEAIAMLAACVPLPSEAPHSREYSHSYVGKGGGFKVFFGPPGKSRC